MYTRVHKCNHPISKALLWLARSAKFWTSQEWSHILLCWGPFLYIPWLCVCQFSRKNLAWNVWEKVPNFGYYIKNHFYVIPKVWNFFPEISAKIFFLKIGILSPKVIREPDCSCIEVLYFVSGPHFCALCAHGACAKRYFVERVLNDHTEWPKHWAFTEQNRTETETAKIHNCSFFLIFHAKGHIRKVYSI